MSFKIFASGSGSFNYQKDDCIDGDNFEPVKILSALNGMSPNKAGVIVAGVQIGMSKVLPSADIIDVVGGIALYEFLHTLKTAVDLLAMCSSASEGWISVSSTNKHLLWVDTVRFAKYSFSPGDNPGAEFVKAITQSLKDTSLNNWGVLRALTTVLTKFHQKIGDSTKPAINISLTK